MKKGGLETGSEEAEETSSVENLAETDSLEMVTGTGLLHETTVTETTGVLVPAVVTIGNPTESVYVTTIII